MTASKKTSKKTSKNNKSRTVAAKASTSETKTETAKTETTDVAVQVKASAIMKDHANRIVDAYEQEYDVRDEAASLSEQARVMRASKATLTTLGIVAAARQDDRIKPDLAITGSNAVWRKQMSLLRQVFNFENADGTKTALGARFFPEEGGPSKEDAKANGDIATVRRYEQSANWSTLVKKAAPQAFAAIEAGAELDIDETTGCLLIAKPGKLPVKLIGKDTSPIVLTGKAKRSGASVSASADSLRDIGIAKADPKKAKELEAKKAASSAAKGKGSPQDVDVLANAYAQDDKALSAACNVIITMTRQQGDAGFTKSQHDLLTNMVNVVSDVLEASEVK